MPRGGRVRLGVVEGDLHAGKRVRIDVDGRLVVMGRARFDGDAEVLGDMECRGLEGDGGEVSFEGALNVTGPIRVHDGAVEVKGRLTAEDIDVDRALRLRADATARRVEVGGLLESGPSLDATRVEVGGKFRADGRVHAQEVEVGGAADLKEVDVERLEAGGSISVGSGSIRDRIDVGGRFTARGDLAFGDLDVGGVASLGGSAKGRSIDVGGFFRADGDLVFERFEVGGLGEIRGQAVGETVDVGGRLRVGRSLTLTGRLKVGGQITVEGELTAQEMDVGGSVSADKAVVKERAEIGGRVSTHGGLRAATIVLHRRSRALGPLVGGRVELGPRTNVEDVYGSDVRLEDGGQARRIVADSVTVEAGATVGEVVYTRSATIHPSARLGQPPRKVAQLDPFPS